MHTEVAWAGVGITVRAKELRRTNDVARLIDLGRCWGQAKSVELAATRSRPRVGEALEAWWPALELACPGDGPIPIFAMPARLDPGSASHDRDTSMAKNANVSETIRGQKIGPRSPFLHIYKNLIYIDLQHIKSRKIVIKTLPPTLVSKCDTPL